jgi:dTDP-4-dehydrorhamnose reductase
MDTKCQSYHPEIWGGLECTINRIGNTFRDQLVYAQYYQRENVIELIASLGIKKLRFPILWEAHQQKSSKEKIDWSRTKNEIEKLRFYNITPIAGLLHHGSGPRFTSILNKNFPLLFSEYAAKVASEFPWLEYFTPVNEPLTTARFSCIYGYWYPHHKDEFSFVNFLLNELKATVLAMKAIRKIIPAAKLVQTEDITKTHSTPKLKYQAVFENRRRWLTYDILCGKLDKQHFFWRYFTEMGVKEEKLQFFLDNPCPPDIAGFNYYVTSERYLDDNIQEYSPKSYGGNGIDIYADVEAVRAVKPSGLSRVLKEAWNRFHLPIALTEVQMHCTREEQLRWFKEAWDGTIRLKKKGIDIQAITSWSLLGAFDWNSLLTREEGNYESGVFDIRSNNLRPTAMANLVRSLATSGSFKHPVIKEKGWWHKSFPNHRALFSNAKNTPLLIVGSDTALGTAIKKMCEMRSICFKELSSRRINMEKATEIKSAVDEYKPWAIINSGGYLEIDGAETEKEKCFRLNANRPSEIARICNNAGIQFLTFSSDLVFDGEKQNPYVEIDSVKPLSVFGESKALGERLVLKNCPSSLIIRTGTCFGPWHHYNIASSILETLKKGGIFHAVEDVTVSPSYLPDLVNTALDLLIDEESGIWHLSNHGIITWFGFAQEVALRAGYHKRSIVACKQEQKNWRAKRPGYSALKSDKGIQLPTLSQAIDRFFEEKTS